MTWWEKLQRCESQTQPFEPTRPPELQNTAYLCVYYFFCHFRVKLERRGKFGALNNSNVNILNNITPPVSRKDRSRFVKYFIRVFEMFTNILVFCNFIANICSTSMNFSPKVNVHRKPQNNFIKSYNLSYYNVHFLTQYDL